MRHTLTCMCHTLTSLVTRKVCTMQEPFAHVPTCNITTVSHDVTVFKLAMTYYLSLFLPLRRKNFCVPVINPVLIQTPCRIFGLQAMIGTEDKNKQLYEPHTSYLCHNEFYPQYYIIIIVIIIIHLILQTSTIVDKELVIR